MPSNIVAERNTLGILMHHVLWRHDIGHLRTQFFQNRLHRILYHVLSTQDVDTCDPMSLYALVKNTGTTNSQELDLCGGIEYLETLWDITGHYTKKDFLAQAQLIFESSYARDCLEDIEDFKRYLENGEKKSIDMIRQYRTKQERSLVEAYTVAGQYHLLGDLVDTTLQAMEEDLVNGQLGLPPKIRELSSFFSYRKGELVIYGARAKFGKSVLGLNEAHHLAVEQHIPVLYMDTEMDTRTFLARLLALDAQVPIRDIETFSYRQDPVKNARVQESIQRIKKAPLIHRYDPYWTKEKVRNDTIVLKHKHHIALLIYDYIKIKEVGRDQSQEHNELGNWAIFLKDLAGELKIPVITMAQLSPYELRLADSDKLNRYASTVCYLLHCSEETKTRLALQGYHDAEDHIIIAYNRNGAATAPGEDGVAFSYQRDMATMHSPEKT